MHCNREAIAVYTECQRFLGVPIIQKFKEANLLEIYPWYAALAKRAQRPLYIDQMNAAVSRKLE